MNKTCKHCDGAFRITDSDLALIEKLSPIITGKKELIPPPTLCPDCRQQRRLTFRNDRHLYARKCDAIGKSIVAMYQDSTTFPVYSSEYWWSEKWNASDFQLSWNPTESFFTQFATLLKKVPRLACSITASENCEFNNYCAGSKNCYMSQRVGDCEDAYYSYLPTESRSVCDCYNISECELCYEIVDGTRCYNTHYSQNVVNCTDSQFLFNCRDCKNCCLCTNMRNQQYCFRNEKCSKEEYERKLAEIERSNFAVVAGILDTFDQTKKTQIVPALWSSNCENVSGNYLTECKNAENSYDCRHCEDISYAYGHVYGNDSMDTTFNYHCSQCYDFAAGVRSQELLFCFNILSGSSNLLYCIDCVNGSKNLFGCVSMKHAEYCILNKQYTKEEYERLVPQIIAKMRVGKEYGEYFPTSISPFAYNETVAQEYFPLTEDQVRKEGLRWLDSSGEKLSVSRIIRGAELPPSIDDIPDDILNWAIECDATKKPFRIIRQELEFYRKMRLPVPRLHPDERHRRRMALRNPRKLWKRECAKCSAAIATSYSPDRPETVYCEKCYLDAVY